uniref:Thymidine kinase n=1 Tax=Terrapene triunguis TaxID=2587831 RepID=A0A674IT92_9SAUR
MRTHVSILLKGTFLVGKTSLIMSLVSEEFPEEVGHPYLCFSARKATYHSQKCAWKLKLVNL